ncbi:sepiapterin reductase a [Chanos chanos]|uniref:Sepiapterin reductase n=1 Tax=Chanos chanos TaxID=29144 RepID=A0A6J2V3B0_CHACN|nr:sepiapterin reductase-like [Chanos chanos]
MAVSKATDLGKALCIITGASKGFGRSLAKEISGLLQPESVLVLVARSGNKLSELQTELDSLVAGKHLVIRCVIADLGLREGVEQVMKSVRELTAVDIDHLLLFNNAASLGDVSRYAQSFENMEEVDSYLSFNVSSALCLTAGVLNAFPRRQGLRRFVVNISSLCAVKPFPSWVLYCTGKAARDMMFRVLAEEDPDLRVLSYAPGPLDTDMQLQARSSSADSNLRQIFTVLHSEGQLLTCEQSISKLLKVLLEDEFSSGAHIDYYDL